MSGASLHGIATPHIASPPPPPHAMSLASVVPGGTHLNPPTPSATTPWGILVPPKLAQKIWRGQFIEMNELLQKKLGQPDEGLGQTSERRKKRRVTGILQWVECFHSYIGVVAQQQPDRVVDLLAYASLIVHAAQKFKGEGWQQYDRNFHKFAEVHPGGSEHILVDAGLLRSTVSHPLQAMLQPRPRDPRVRRFYPSSRNNHERETSNRPPTTNSAPLRPGPNLHELEQAFLLITIMHISAHLP